MTDAKQEPLDDRVEAAIDDAKAAADRAADDAAGTVEELTAAATEAAEKVATVVSDAASQARAVAADALDDAGEFFDDASDWLEEKYRENPALVLGVAAAAGIALLVGVGAIARAVFRR
ncbi:hypothetical protein [Agromyces arachidis]|uniref:hypothetical protein n=1 Tax=Agromyces arachidis TaxID=766966 RepID=UPI00405678C0